MPTQMGHLVGSFLVRVTVCVAVWAAPVSKCVPARRLKKKTIRTLVPDWDAHGDMIWKTTQSFDFRISGGDYLCLFVLHLLALSPSCQKKDAEIMLMTRGLVYILHTRCQCYAAKRLRKRKTAAGGEKRPKKDQNQRGPRTARSNSSCLMTTGSSHPSSVSSDQTLEANGTSSSMIHVLYVPLGITIYLRQSHN